MPQTFIAGERVGGYDALRKRFGLNAEEEEDARYTPPALTAAPCSVCLRTRNVEV